MTPSTAVERAFDAMHHLGDARAPWTDILEGLRQLAGGDSASFLLFDRADQLLQIAHHNSDPQAQRDYAEHYQGLDILKPLTRGVAAGRWIDTAQAYTPAQLSGNVFYADFMCRHRMPQVLALMVDVTPARFAALSVQRGHVTHDMHRVLDSGPALQFATGMQHALDRVRQRSAQAWSAADAAFSGFGEALWLLTPSGMVLQHSACARQWLCARGALVVRDGRLQHPEPRQQAALRQALCRAAQDPSQRRLLLLCQQGLAVRLELTRADHAMSLSGESLVLMRLCRAADTGDTDPAQLARAFGLTPAETRVLLGLMKGLRPKALAEMHQVSLTTVRTQLAALMGKMHCERQADLIRKTAAFR